MSEVEDGKSGLLLCCDDLRVSADSPAATHPPRNPPERHDSGIDIGTLGSSLEIEVVLRCVLVRFPVLVEIPMTLKTLAVGNLDLVAQLTQAFASHVAVIGQAVWIAPLDVQKLPQKREHRTRSEMSATVFVSCLRDGRIDSTVAFGQGGTDNLVASYGTRRAPGRVHV